MGFVERGLGCGGLGVIHLIFSVLHYRFNLPWLGQPGPRVCDSLFHSQNTPMKPLLILLLAALSASAEEIVPLWPDGPPDSKGLSIREIVNERGSAAAHDRSNSAITEPTLEVFRPEKPTGTSLMILPGGGYSNVVMDKEGRDIARWFSGIGVTGFVLKYRLPNAGDHRFGEKIPLDDAKRGIALIRQRAADFGIRPDHVGVIGFSAGGHLASTLGTRFDEATRPDFLLLGYPVISMKSGIGHGGSCDQLIGKNPSQTLIDEYSNELHVTKSTPPVFLFCATDDTGVKVENSQLFYDAARAAGVPAELHIFAKGGHGFGMRPNSRAGTAWPPLAESWLREVGMLGGEK